MSLVFIIRIYHDARSSECQILDICVRKQARTRTHARTHTHTHNIMRVCERVLHMTTGYARTSYALRVMLSGFTP